MHKKSALKIFASSALISPHSPKRGVAFLKFYIPLLGDRGKKRKFEMYLKKYSALIFAAKCKYTGVLNRCPILKML
jgi:hypothetical protein